MLLSPAEVDCSGYDFNCFPLLRITLLSHLSLLAGGVEHNSWSITAVRSQATLDDCEHAAGNTAPTVCFPESPQPRSGYLYIWVSTTPPCPLIPLAMPGGCHCNPICYPFRKVRGRELDHSKVRTSSSAEHLKGMTADHTSNSWALSFLPPVL